MGIHRALVPDAELNDMAAEASIAFGADDWFEMKSNVFYPQNSFSAGEVEFLHVFDEKANRRFTSAKPADVKVESEYKYTGTDLKTDLGLVASAFRSQNSSFHLDSVIMAFSTFDYPLVTISGHAHFLSSGHFSTSFDWSAFVPAMMTGGRGTVGIISQTYALVPSLPDAALTDMIITAESSQIQVRDHLGVHKFGGNLNLKVSVSASGVGDLEKIRTGLGDGWFEDYRSIPTSNSDHDGWTIDAHAYVNRT